MTPTDIGHNNPPTSESAFLSELEARHGDLLERRAFLIGAVERVPETIEDADTAGKAAKFVKQLQGFDKVADRARKDEKEPYFTRGKWVDSWFRDAVVDGLADAKKTMTLRITAYQRRIAEEERQRRAEEERRQREEARRAAEEEERKRREADEAAKDIKTEADLDEALRKEAQAAEAERRKREEIAAAERARSRADAKAAELSRERYSGGATASLRTVVKCTGFDQATVDLEALRSHFAPADIEKAIRAFIRDGGRTLKGAEISEVTESRIT